VTSAGATRACVSRARASGSQWPARRGVAVGEAVVQLGERGADTGQVACTLALSPSATKVATAGVIVDDLVDRDRRAVREGPRERVDLPAAVRRRIHEHAVRCPPACGFTPAAALPHSAGLDYITHQSA
jgi:hypothetical protein